MVTNVRVGERTFCLRCESNMGLYLLPDHEAVLIDSGETEADGAAALSILREMGLRLKAIFNTHCHADHVAGNALLQRETGCRIFAAGVDQAVVSHMTLSPTVVCGGFPAKALRKPILLSRDSACEPLTAADLPEGLTPIPLRGHSYDQMGFRTADDVVFLADAVLSEAMLARHGVFYLYDVAEHLRTLQTVRELRARLFIPAHGEITAEIGPLAETNEEWIRRIEGLILRFCAAPRSADEIIGMLFAEFGLKVGYLHWTVVSFTVRSYLSWLHDEGRLTALPSEGLLKWRVP